MRDVHICPKCKHNEILFIPTLADASQAGTVNTLSVAKISTFLTHAEHGTFYACICRKCGYAELYTYDPASIPLDKIPGAKILVGVTPR